MLQIIVQGRGGQGAQTAGNLLAAAFFATGRQVQCFATYGGARRGTPVSSFIRVDDRPVRVRCDIERADAILCFDASLLAGPLLAAADEKTLIVVNSAQPAAALARTLAGAHAVRHVLPVDALAISQRHGLGHIVNSALLGAFARAIGEPALPVLEATLTERSPKLHAQNIAACEDGWRLVDAQLHEEAASR
jgi:pyruvate ferredoxin oxidoreductase gamma subunit